MHPNHISRLEKDLMTPRASTLAKVAQVFGVDKDDLLAASQGELQHLASG